MLYDEVMNAARFIESEVSCRPETAVILGSGLGSFADGFEGKETVPYSRIPGFPESAVSGHAARLVFGRTGGAPAVAMQGRYHFYEGHSMKRLVFPVFVLRALGVKNIVITNACGGIDGSLSPGDLMLITDHINLTGQNPLIGENDERFGPRFPDMTEVYSRELCDLARRAAGELGVTLKEGVYAFFTGPCFETAAEIRALRALGADAVGMSTVPEATAARYLGMAVLGVSCITNMATGIAKERHSHGEVLRTAEAAGETFRRLLGKIVPAISGI